MEVCAGGDGGVEVVGGESHQGGGLLLAGGDGAGGGASYVVLAARARGALARGGVGRWRLVGDLADKEVGDLLLGLLKLLDLENIQTI